jgi:plasmid maintenance system antidote protein VapI
MTSIDYLDRVKERYAVTDYGAAPLIGITRATVSNVRTGRAGFGERPALQIAKLLDLKPHQVLADLMAEKAPNAEIKQVWQEISNKFAACLCALFLTATIVSHSTLADPPDQRINHPNLYYVKLIAHHYRHTLRLIRRIICGAILRLTLRFSHEL